MVSFPPSLQKLIRELSKLPTIGEKSATRLAYHLVQGNKDLARSLAEVLRTTVDKVGLCEQCFFLCEGKTCSVCSDPRRDRSIFCVVEKPSDVLAVERMGEFQGLYHVLHGLWAPLRGMGPDSMKLKELVHRVEQEKSKELILATNCTVEGEATALYIARMFADKGIVCSRLAQGMPKGAELEYADDTTLSRAFSGRQLLGKAA